MTYQTGTANNANDLLEKFRLFLLDLGWTQRLFATEEQGQRLHLSKDNIVVHLRSMNNDNRSQPYTNRFGILFNVSDQFDANAPWDLQPNTPRNSTDQAISPMIDQLQTGAFKYHFFHLTQPTVVACIVEYEADHFAHLIFGKIKKYGQWSGGLFFSGSWYRAGGHGRVYNTGPFQDTYNNSLANSFVQADVDGHPWLSCGNAPANGNQSTNRLVRGFHYWHKPLFDHSPSRFSGLSTLIPIQLFAQREDNFFSPIGELAHIRYINLKPFIPGQIIQYGSDQWMVFPFHYKGVYARPRLDQTGNMGYAMRVVS
jgi:hypothetical protein